MCKLEAYEGVVYQIQNVIAVDDTAHVLAVHGDNARFRINATLVEAVKRQRWFLLPRSTSGLGSGVDRLLASSKVTAELMLQNSSTLNGDFNGTGRHTVKQYVQTFLRVDGRTERQLKLNGYEGG